MAFPDRVPHPVVRTYGHVLLRSVLSVPGHAANIEAFCARHRNTFPLRAVAVLTPAASSIQRCLELVAIALLRSKGYRIAVASGATTEQDRREELRPVARFFQSLGETAVEYALESSGDLSAGPCDLMIAPRGSGFGPVTDVFFFPDAGDPDIQDPSKPLGEYAGQLLKLWEIATAFDRPFRALPAGGGGIGDSLARSNHRSNLTQLQSEIAGRLAYQPVIEPAQVNLLARETLAVYASPDATALWRALAKANDEGLAIDSLAALLNGDYPRVLAALRRLLASKLVAQVGDHFWRTPGAAWSASVDEDPGACTPFPGNSNFPAGSGSNRHVTLYCVFSQGTFGYDTDDDEKCTAVRMIKASEATICAEPPPGCVLLDPCADEELSAADLPRLFAEGACVIDAPWYKLPALSLSLEAKRSDWARRRLRMPPQNNAYYHRTTRVSSAGAAAYVCAFAGCWEQVGRILGLFEWGPGWNGMLSEFHG